MSKKFLMITISVFLAISVAGSVLYMAKGQPRHNEAEKVKQQYDKYMTQWDKLEEINSEVSPNTPLKYISEEDFDKEWSKEDEARYQLFLKAEKAKAYLLEHAPHLLPTEKSSEEIEKESIEALLKIDPEAAERLKARYAEIDKKVKAEFDAKIAEFDQELIDHRKSMKEFDKQREHSQKSFADAKAERERDSADFEARFQRLKDQIILNEKGELIGIKNPSKFPGIIQNRNNGSDTQEDAQDDELLTSQSQASPQSEDDVDAINPPLQKSELHSNDNLLHSQRLLKGMSTLNSDFYGTYPDVVIRQYLSDAEYQRLFPNLQSQRDLDGRTTALKSEYVSRIQSMLNEISGKERSRAIKSIRESLIYHWDDTLVEEIMKELE